MPITAKIYTTTGQLGPTDLARDGPRFEVEVGITNALQTHLQQKNMPVPNPVKGMGLIDTGAAVSCIDDAIATQLGIKPTGTTNAHGMSGPSVRNLYSARITILAGAQKWNYDSTRIMGVNINKQGLIALIGRDLLGKGILVYSGYSGVVELGI